MTAPIEPPGMAEFRRKRQTLFHPHMDFSGESAEAAELLLQKRKLMDQFAPLIQERSHLIFGVPADSVEALPELGHLHSIFEIHARGEKWLLRADMLGVHGRAYDLLIHQQISHLLASRDFPAVRPRGTDLDRIVLPFDFQVTPAPPGKPLSEFRDPGTRTWPEDLLREIGRRMAQVHQWRAAGAGLLDAYYPLTGVHETWPDYLLPKLPDHLHKCEQMGAINHSDHQGILAIFQRGLPILKSASTHLLHGSWNPQSIYIHENEIVAIVNWENSLAGDPVFDLAAWGTFNSSESTGPLISGYISESKIDRPEDFDLRYWLYYLRIALAKTLRNHLFSPQAFPHDPLPDWAIASAISELQELGL